MERLAEAPSTMDAVHERAQAGAEEGLWLVAARQTQGRGRRGRSWLASEGALATTLLLRPARRRAGLMPGEAATLSFVAALALRDALLRLGVGAEVTLKWPNDVLVGGAKIAGILLESGGARGEEHLAIGVGLNVAAAPKLSELEEAALRPTSLADAGVATTAEAALDALADAFEPRYTRWISGGFADQREEWLSAAAGLGGPIEARLGAETIKGRFADVDAEGALIIDASDGRRRILAADVFLPGQGGQ